VVVLGNRGGGDVGTLARKLLEAALGEKIVEKEKPKPITAPMPLDAYAGAYLNRDQRVEVKVAGSEALEIKTPESTIRVTHLARNCFVGPKGESFCFVAGDAGRIRFLHTGLVAFAHVGLASSGFRSNRKQQ